MSASLPPPVAERASAADVAPLRTAVLRPAWTDRLAAYPQDDEALHLAVRQHGQVVGVATAYAAPPPEGLRGAIPDEAFEPGAAFQFRGMATSEAVRGTGVGAAVLRGVYRAVQAEGGQYVWCNARTGAVGFYERMGMEAVGPEFDVSEIGPHVVMWRRM